MTFSTLASPGVSLQGGGGSGGGGGGTPGGSNTQIQYNSSGTFAGASGLTTNGTELTVASGTQTADAPVLNMSQTWNNGATTFTALKFNITDTASAAASLLMDLQVGGSSRFNVGKTGSLKLGVNPTGTNQAGTNVTIAGSQGTGTGAGGSIVFQVAPAGGSSGTAQNALATVLQVNGNGGVTGQDGATANTLALRNGTNAQTFNIYNTFTDASNYERLRIVAQSGGSVIIGTQKAGTGVARALELQVDGTTRLTLGTTNGNASIGGTSSASGQGAFAAGQLATASGQYAIAIGDQATASALSSVAIQNALSVSANFAFGIGRATSADKISQFAVGTERFSANDIAQYSTLILSESTTDATPKALTIRLYSTSAGQTRATVPASTTWAFTAHISGRSASGTDNAYYIRQGVIKRDASNNTTLVGTVQTIGTDIESNAAWDVSVTADDTNECLAITVTGVAATNIRWLAKVDLVEVGYP